MKKPILAAILAAILASLSCGTYVTPTPTVSPVTPTAPATPTLPPTATVTVSAAVASSTDTAAVIRSSVAVHTTPDSKELAGYVYGGQQVDVLSCSGDWCEIRTDVLTGFVFRGCLSGNEDKGCTAK